VVGYGRGVKRFSISVMLALALVGLAAATNAEEPTRPRLVFHGDNDFGEVWANVGLTAQRLDEAYIPMVVMVVNRSRETVVIDRDSLRLIGAGGVRYPMPTLKELRNGYRKVVLDARAVSGAGIPWEVWSRERRLVDSNFFPNITSDRRAIVIDEVSLPPAYALIDLVYFAKPAGLGIDEPFILEVHAIGWDAPLRLGIVLG